MLTKEEIIEIIKESPLAVLLQPCELEDIVIGIQSLDGTVNDTSPHFS